MFASLIIFYHIETWNKYLIQCSIKGIICNRGNTEAFMYPENLPSKLKLF